jgi:hypothetical protein
MTVTPTPSSTGGRICKEYTVTIPRGQDQIWTIKYVDCDNISQVINHLNPGPLPGFVQTALFGTNLRFLPEQTLVICSLETPIICCDFQCSNLCPSNYTTIEETGICPLCSPCAQFLITVQQGAPGIPFQGCVEQLIYRNCNDQVLYLNGLDLGYTTSYIPQTQFTICSCDTPQFVLGSNCEDAACVVKINNECTDRVCFTWEIVVPQQGSVSNLEYTPCDTITPTQYPTTITNTLPICSITVPKIITGTQGTFVRTMPSLTLVCSNPIPNLPVSVGSCFDWEFQNSLLLGETVTFIYTDCDRVNFVMTVDDQFDTTNFTICSFYGPIFISGTPTNDVFQKLTVFQTTISQCGCYYGCSSGYECLPLVRADVDMVGQESWTIPFCGGSNVPQISGLAIGTPIPFNYELGYSACTVNPFQWWSLYSNLVGDSCQNITLNYPTIIPGNPNPSTVLGGWRTTTQDVVTQGITIFDFATQLNNPQSLGLSCGCNDVGFPQESCVVLRDCCTDNIVYTGTILNSNYAWVSNNYTVDNLGLTDCCLYLDDFEQPVVSTLEGSDLIKKDYNYTYPSNGGYIANYQYTSCIICNPPLPSLTPTATYTPTPTPLPIYSWSWTNQTNIPNNFFKCSQNSCNITQISVSRFTNNQDIFNYLNNLGNNVEIEVFNNPRTRSRRFRITNTQIQQNQTLFIFTVVGIPPLYCPNSQSWNFSANQVSDIKFYKR